MTQTLYDDAHVSVTLDDVSSVVRYKRSRQPYPSLEVMRAVHAKVRSAFESLPSGKLALLLDVRDAPPRNDEGFEAEVQNALRALAERFPRRATLVRTAVGRLQTQRIAREGDRSVETFSDEAQALAYLTRP